MTHSIEQPLLTTLELASGLKPEEFVQHQQQVGFLQRYDLDS